MTASTHRDGSSLVSDLVTWIGAITPDPDIRVEEYVEGDRHVVRADLPGIDVDKDLDVTVEGGLLRLRGQRREDEQEKTRTEICYGTFERVLALPSGTTAGDVSATYEDGVLTVTFPMAGAPTPQQIPISRGEPPVE
jgi:HSP20 family protein